MKKIYCLSGIGADERIFCNLSVDGYELVHLPWIKHEKNETLQHYALRIAAGIKEQNSVILGLSFGGMLATEIAKAIPVRKAFLISSATTTAALPSFNPLMLALLKSQRVPSFIYSFPNPYVCKIFGATNKDERALLNGIIRDADGDFVRWAFSAIINWKNEEVPSSIVHIHGTSDKVLPSAQAAPDYWIEGGTHLMVYNRAREIAGIIEKELG